MWIVIGIIIYIILFTFWLLLFNGTKHDNDEKGGSKDA